MNIKLHTPKSLQNGSGLSSKKQFLLSLLATTISIVLTFGTAAIIDHRKKEDLKHEIVMMVMYDMHKSLLSIEEIDSMLRKSMQLQLQIAKDTTQFGVLTQELRLQMPFFLYAETTERIFSTSIETISTLGNVLFAENVAEFYLVRKFYKAEVCDTLLARINRDEPYNTLKGTLKFDFFQEALMSSGFLFKMKQQFAQCKQMMDVTDEELDAYMKERERIEENTSGENKTGISVLNEVSQLQDAINEAKNKLGW